MAEDAQGRRSRRGGSRKARRETSAGGVVYRHGEPHFLLIRDPYGNWGLPKGHVEEGESVRQAALREVAEETGLDDVRVESELPSIDWYFRDRGRLVHKFCHFFLMECVAGEARPCIDEGISACVWLPFAEALRTITYDNARQVLLHAGSLLGLAGDGGGSHADG